MEVYHPYALRRLHGSEEENLKGVIGMVWYTTARTAELAQYARQYARQRWLRYNVREHATTSCVYYWYWHTRGGEKKAAMLA